MFDSFVEVFPWDLHDGDIERVLDHLQGELGIEALVIPVLVPPLTQLRLREISPRVFRTRGGAFFHPDEDRYHATRCKVSVSSWLKQKHPFENTLRVCTERGIRVYGAVSLMRYPRVARRHPEFAVRNAIGDSSTTFLCPFHADVESFGAAVMADVSSRVGVTGIHLFDPDSCTHHGDGWDSFAGQRLEPFVRFCLSLCFCESCFQRAHGTGFDLEKARKMVCTLINDAIHSAVNDSSDWQARVVSHEALMQLLQWRALGLASVLSRLVEASNVDVWLDRGGIDAEYVSGISQWPDVCGVVANIGSIKELNALDATQRGKLCMRVGGEVDGTDLVKLLQQASSTGVSSALIGNYGVMPSSREDFLRQAVRFSRRTSSV